METVWVLTQGEYSDYKIIAVCSERPKWACGDFGINVEEWSLDQFNPEEDGQWLVFFDAEGNIVEASFEPAATQREVRVFSCRQPSVAAITMGVERIRAGTREKAVKIACDERRTWLAEQEICRAEGE